MRLISLLIVLLLTGLLIMKQLNLSSSDTVSQEVVSGEGVTVPQVPASPKDVKQFEEDMKKFMQDTVDQRSKELEKQLSQ